MFWKISVFCVVILMINLHRPNNEEDDDVRTVNIELGV
jgi:hypothetical protein